MRISPHVELIHFVHITTTTTGDADRVQAYMEANGAEGVDIEDARGFTPLIHAAKNGVEALLSHAER